MIRRYVALAAVAVVAGACQLPTPPATTPPESVRSTTTEPNSTTSVPMDVHAALAPLVVDDNPNPQHVPYHREDFQPNGWEDPDGNGCDAREDTLIRDSLDPVQRGSGCKITAGRWPLAYITGETTDPRKLDIDHVVPLGAAHESGAWAWTPAIRHQYSNDPAVLWAVDAGQNRAKGDKDPSEWRPPLVDSWCTYAHRWVDIKVTYHLTVRTPERDALGAMLETC